MIFFIWCNVRLPYHDAVSLFLFCVQKIHRLIKDTVTRLCPKPLSVLMVKGSRYAVNIVDRDLPWHHDMVRKGAFENNLTIPGLTCVVHLGTKKNQKVCLRILHSPPTVTAPLLALTPGFSRSCIWQSTLRTRTFGHISVSWVCISSPTARGGGSRLSW